MLDWLISKLCRPGSVIFGNCLLAFLLQWRHGGHIVISRSLSHDWIPHVSWTDQLPQTLVLQFVPIERRYGWRALFHSPLFRGQWKKEIIGGNE